MKISKMFGFSVSALLIIAGLAFIIIPVKCFLIYVNEYSFSDASDLVKEAIGNVFYKGDAVNFSSDFVPSLDPAIEKADLPPQVTPELVTKIVVAQAVADNYLFQARSFPLLAIMLIGLFCAIGVVAILLGISLLLMWRKLDVLSGVKEPDKGTDKEKKNKIVFDWNGKTNWKFIAVILAVAVLIGIGLILCIRKQTETSYIPRGGGDGVCDNTADGVCDPDCPVAPDPNADPDCANLPAQK